jgi:hypothetical protein
LRFFYARPQICITIGRKKPPRNQSAATLARFWALSRQQRLR